MLNKCNKLIKFMFSNNYYHVLGVTQNSSFIDIKKNYLQKIKLNHPDVEQGDHSKFLELKKAFETLNNPTKRKLYDKSIGIQNPTWQFYAESVSSEFNNGQIQEILEGKIQNKVKIKTVYDNLTMRCREQMHQKEHKRNMYKTMILPLSAFGVFWMVWSLAEHFIVNYKGDTQYQQNFSKKGKDLSIVVTQIR